MKNIILSKFFLIILLIYQIECGQFGVSVELGDQFKSVQGALKIIINDSNKNLVNLTETLLMPRFNYLNFPYLNMTIDQINHLTFFWIQSPPIPPEDIFKKRFIYLNKIKIYPYIPNIPDGPKNVKFFCPLQNSAPVERKEKMKLFHCK